MATPIEQLLSRTVYSTDGATTVWDFSFSGGYIYPAHVKAYTEAPDGNRTDVTLTLTGPYQVTIAPPLAVGAKLVIYRDTPKDLPLVDFADESGFSETALDTNARQAVFIAAEAADIIALSNFGAAVEAAELAASSASAANIDASSAASSASAAASSSLSAGLAASNAAASAASAANTVSSLQAAGGAALVGNTPAGGVSAATVQGAINELDGEKVAISSLAASSGASLVGYMPAGAGAVATTAQSKLREGVSVTDKGADKTGVVSFSAALQAAIDDLPSTGGKITVPSGAYLSSTQINVNKPLVLVLEGVVITTTSGIGFDHTSSNFTIMGSGDSTSLIKHSGTNHCIYSHGASSATGKYLGRFVAENVGIIDLLTTQTTSQFADWSTTRTAGAGIYSTSPMCCLKNVNTFGFFDGVKAEGILASTWDSVRSAWSARDGLHIGAASTSVTLNNCYAFAPQRDGIRLEDNVFYCTLNSTASDAAGRYAYYFGPGEINGLSPKNITLNSIGCEESGYLNVAGASVYFDGVKNIVLNSPFITGFEARLANTVNGIAFAGTVSSNVTLNLGILGEAGNTLGGYGLYIPTGKYAGKLTILGAPSSTAATLGSVLDTDHVIEYLQGNQPYRYTFQATESTAAGATPTYLSSFYDVHSDNTITTYKVTMTARQTAGAGGTVGQGASYVFYKTIRVIGGVVTYVGATVFAMAVEDDVAWDADLVNDSGGARLLVTGALNETISWQYTIERNRVSV